MEQVYCSTVRMGRQIKLIILILSGQPVFVNQLSRQVHEALRQCIIVNDCLKGLTKPETKEYILSRLQLAGCHEPVFSEDTFELLFSCTSGCIKPLHQLTKMSLVLRANEKLQSIDAQIVFRAQKKLDITA